MAADAIRILSNQLQGPGQPGGRDLRDVPDDGPADVEVGRRDEKDAPFGVLRRNVLQHLLCHVLPDQSPEGSRVRHRVAVEDREQRPLFGNVMHGDARVERLQPLVVGFAQESERGDQRSRAHTGHELELRPRAILRPAVQEAGAEGAVIASAGDGEVSAGRHRPAVSLALEGGLLARVRLEVVPFELRHMAGVPGEVPDPGRKPSDVRCRLERVRNGLAPRRGSAGLEKDDGRCQKHQNKLRPLGHRESSFHQFQIPGEPLTARRSARTRARADWIRPAGIEASAASRRASIAPLSVPVTSQSTCRARLSAG